MSPTPYIKELLSISVHLAESLCERIPKSSSLQRDCKQLATNLRTWRKNLPSDMEFLLKPTGDKGLYRAILSPLSEMLCVLCRPPSFPPKRHFIFAQPLRSEIKTGQLTWTAHEKGKAASVETISRTAQAEQKIQSASPAIKKAMDDLDVWRKPKKDHAPLALLFDQTSRSDKRFIFAENAVNEHVGACYSALMELTKKIERARSRHVGLRLLAGKATA